MPSVTQGFILTLISFSLFLACCCFPVCTVWCRFYNCWRDGSWQQSSLSQTEGSGNVLPSFRLLGLCRIQRYEECLQWGRCFHFPLRESALHPPNSLSEWVISPRPITRWVSESNENQRWKWAEPAIHASKGHNMGSDDVKIKESKWEKRKGNKGRTSQRHFFYRYKQRKCLLCVCRLLIFFFIIFLP